MFRVEVDGKLLGVTFEYTRRVPTHWNGDPILSRKGRPREVIDTSCLIESRPLDGPKDVWEVISTGKAMCCPTDKFEKTTGRKLALTKATEGLDGQLISLIWRTYSAKSKKST